MFIFFIAVFGVLIAALAITVINLLNIYSLKIQHIFFEVDMASVLLLKI